MTERESLLRADVLAMAERAYRAFFVACQGWSKQLHTRSLWQQAEACEDFAKELAQRSGDTE